MKKVKFSYVYPVLGLSCGLVSMLYGSYLSSAIPNSPMLMGLMAAVWCACSAGILSRYTSKNNPIND